MKIAELLETAMEWTLMIEGCGELGEVQRGQLRIEKGIERLKSGEIGLSIDDGKRIMTLQELVVKQVLATYALARRLCPECTRFRPVKHYTIRKIRTVFGIVGVWRNLPSIRWSQNGWSKINRCVGRRAALISCCRFEPP